MKDGRVKKYVRLGLPEDVARKLVEAGINTPRQVRAMAEAALLAVEGIGPDAVREVREALGGGE